ncbi:MAG TPA: NADH-quinone oxidoreductase subunit I [Armatimonadota bacterium]|nr:NADH-quinone oxidoreductase subunit I [Armatimonadota bacterium]
MSKALRKIGAYTCEGFYALYSIAKGLIVTLINLLRGKVTLMYPEARWELPEGYRGFPALPVDPETGQDVCIGCGACARICPTQLIAVEAHMTEDKKRVVDSFVMNAGLCMFCGLCADVCPVGAIIMSDNYELSAFSRDDLIYDRRKLNELGGLRKPEPKPEEPVASGSAEERA